MPKIYRFESKKNTNKRTKSWRFPNSFFKQSKTMSGCAPKKFHSIQQMISHHTEFLCASVVVIQCEKRIKANKIAFAVTINSGCFGRLPLFAIVHAGILDLRICGLPETTKRKSNYCFNKKFDRFCFYRSQSHFTHIRRVLFSSVGTCSITIFMATIKHLHEMMNLLRIFSINSWNSSRSIECDFINFSLFRRWFSSCRADNKNCYASNCHKRMTFFNAIHLQSTHKESRKKAEIK